MTIPKGKEISHARHYANHSREYRTCKGNGSEANTLHDHQMDSGGRSQSLTDQENLYQQRKSRKKDKR